jgi:high-affinity Fe2+/Pb2+ permease
VFFEILEALLFQREIQFLRRHHITTGLTVFVIVLLSSFCFKLLERLDLKWRRGGSSKVNKSLRSVFIRLPLYISKLAGEKILLSCKSDGVTDDDACIDSDSAGSSAS